MFTREQRITADLHEKVSRKAGQAKRRHACFRDFCRGFEPLEQRYLLDSALGHDAVQLFSASPALFVANEGQWVDASIRYALHAAGANVLHTDSGPVFQLFQSDPIVSDRLSDEWTHLAERELGVTRQTEFSMHFDGAEQIVPTGLDQSTAIHNYQVGDASTWRSGVPSFETVAYPGLYEGIDLYTWGRRDSLKYEFHVAPGADYHPIQVSYDGIDGLWLDNDGALHITTELTELVDEAPYIYQVIDGEQVEVAGKFSLVDADTYTFEIIGAYDPSLELIIDPEAGWTYLDDDPSNYVSAVAVDDAGNVFITGSNTAGEKADAFVIKLFPNGDFDWSTTLGGEFSDSGQGITGSADGNYVFAVGRTASSGWVTGGYDTRQHGSEAFVVKLDAATGNYNDPALDLWSTYIGGNHAQSGYGITLDATGNILVLGFSSDTRWMSGGFVAKHEGEAEVFVAKLAADGQQLLWVSAFGGDRSTGHAIAVDPDGDILVVGETYSAGWIDSDLDDLYGGERDGFAAKVSADGQQLLWARYLGGSGRDYSHDLAVDGTGDVIVTGTTYSADWLPGLNGERDAYVVRLNPNGQVDWSTPLGGSEGESGFGVALDGEGNALVTGRTSSDRWVTGGFDTDFGGPEDAYVAKVSSGGQHVWSSYVGAGNSGADIALDASGNAYVAGNGTTGAFVAQILIDDANNTPPVADAGGPYSGVEDTVILFDAAASDDPDGDSLQYTWDFGDGTVVETDDSSITHTYLWGGEFTVTVTVSDGRGGFDDATTTASVTELNDPPVADPNGPYSGFVDSAVTFDASGSSDWDNLDGTPENNQTLWYTWDFGDGSDPVTTDDPMFDYIYAANGDYVVTLTVNDGVDSGSATTQAFITTVPTTQTYASADTPLPIPDQGSVTSTIDVSHSYTIDDLTVAIAITHPRPNDLTIVLTHADTTINLNPSGGSGQAFVDQDVAGDWILTVIDGKKKKEGTLHGWSLIVIPATAAADGSGGSPQTFLAVDAVPEILFDFGNQTSHRRDAEDLFVESVMPDHPEVRPILTVPQISKVRAIDEFMTYYGQEREESTRSDRWIEELPSELWEHMQHVMN